MNFTSSRTHSSAQVCHIVALQRLQDIRKSPGNQAVFKHSARDAFTFQHIRHVSCHRQVTVAATAIPAAQPNNGTIGFIGIGIMGLPMALNLIKAGYKVVCWNRSADKCNELAAAGASVASSPADVVQQCTITCAMLADPGAALEVALGPDGVVSAMAPGKGYVDISTVDAETAQKIASGVRAAGGHFLEAPVSGSKGPAEQGQLIFLCAGDADLYAAASPLLDIMGKAKFHLGEVGAGANMKLVVNALMGSMMASFAESISLAEKSGLKGDDLVQVLSLGAMACPMFALKGPAMVENRYPTAFPLKHQQKDLRLALELGQQLGQSLPVSDAANGLYQQALGVGLGDADFSAVREIPKKG